MRYWRTGSIRPGGIVAILGLMTALPALISAHSFWPSNHSARSAVAMTSEGLQAVVVIEVPTILLIEGFKEYFKDRDLITEIEAGRFVALEEEYGRVLFSSFAAGLELYLNDQAAAGSWEPVATPVNGRGTEGFFVYMLEFVFAKPQEFSKSVRVRLVNRTLEDQEVVLANQAEARDGWRVEGSSIPTPEPPAGIPRGAAVEEELALWSMDPEKRDLRIVFTR